MDVRRVWPLLKQTGTQWSEDKVSRLAASLAYYTVLSLAPLLVLAIAVAGLVFGDAARGQIAAQLRSVVGAQAGDAIQTMVAHAQTPSAGIIGTVVGVAVLLVGASGVFGELQDSLNTIWEVAPRPDRGIVGVIKDRFFSFAMVLSVAFLLLVSLVISAALSAIGAWFSGILPGGATLWHVANIVISLAIVAVLFALIFKVVPDVRVRWRDVWLGALVTAVLFDIGKLLIGIYLGRSSVTSPYGAAGSLVVLVIWIYYTAQILFVGAEFTQVYARSQGGVEPTKNAIPLTSEARAQQGILKDREKVSVSA